MSKKSQMYSQSLQDHLSKIKPPCPHSHLPHTNSSSSSKNWVMNVCKHPKTLSLAIYHKHEAANGRSNSNCDNGDDRSATLSDADILRFQNFKPQLYLRDDDEDDQNHKRVSEENQETPKLFGSISFDSPRFMNPPPDLCGSSRFFVAPSLSSSLIEEARTSVTTTTTTMASDEARVTSSSTSMSSSSSTLINDQVKERVNHRPLIREDCVAVCTYSPNPYEDFGRSMQEMVEARLRNNERVDWDFMEELLFCYLNLNEKESYRFILNAFVDLVLVLRQNPESGGSARIVRRKKKIGTREKRKKIGEASI